jgi:hypothetical protein
VGLKRFDLVAKLAVRQDRTLYVLVAAAVSGRRSGVS